MIWSEREAKVCYVTALGAINGIALPESPHQDLDPEIVLMVGPYRNPQARSDMAQFALEKNVDLILLEFENGKARKGPANIAVFERSECGLLTWPECKLWSPAENTLAVIMPNGQAFGFINDGIGLRRVPDVPVTRLRPGMLAARRHLDKVARRVLQHPFAAQLYN